MKTQNRSIKNGRLSAIQRSGLMIAGVWIALSADMLSAQTVRHATDPHGFYLCDGQAGVALGLCNGAVALECQGANAGTDKCLALEERFKTLTGQQDVPWVYQNYPINSYVGPGGVDLETGIQMYDPTNVNPPRCCWDIEAGWEFNRPIGQNPTNFLASACPPTEQDFLTFEEYVLLDGVPFTAVTPQDIDSSTFTSPVDDAGLYMPVLDHGDSAILHTCAGNYFKIGRVTCNLLDSGWNSYCNDPELPDGAVRFYYQLLRRAP